MRSPVEIVDYINELRKQQNMSISQLAKRVGMAKSGVSRYFNHSREFPINRVPKFASSLHVSDEELLGVEDRHPQKETELPANHGGRNQLSSLDKKARYDIAQNLKKLTYGITQKQLSAKTGIPASTLSGYFAHRSTPDDSALQKIADAIGVKKNDIDPRYNFLISSQTAQDNERHPNTSNQVMADNIKYFLHKNARTRHQMADDLDISYSTISSWLQGKAYPRIDKIEMMANYFGISKADLVERRPKQDESDHIVSTPQPQSAAKAHNVVSLPQLTIVQIPILGTIACGEPITAEQNVEGYTHELFDEQPTGTLFALRCKGDSMEPLIPDGSIVLIHQQPTVEDGEIAAVLVDDNNEATLKRVKHTGDQIMLIPENKKYDPILLNKENPGRILGKAVHVDFKL